MKPSPRLRIVAGFGLFLVQGILSPFQGVWGAEEPEPWIRFRAEQRFRYESRQNYDFLYNRPAVDGMADNDDDFLLHRFRLYLDADLHPLLSVHAMFQDSRVFGSDWIDTDALDRMGGNGYENEHDLHEGWLDLKLGDSPLSLQAGRMQLTYGDQRLIGALNWSNVARAFDTARLRYETEDVQLDLVAANVVVVDSNAWDNSNDDDNLLFAYGTFKNLPQGVQDLYLIYRDNDFLNKEIYTVGSRIAGKADCLDWNFEGAYQWGTSTDTLAPTVGGQELLDHEAFAFHAEIGVTQKQARYKPRLAVGYNFATGDEDPNDDSNNTFDNLYPTNHGFYGYIDYFSWRNMHDPYLKLSWEASEKLKFQTHWRLFWLDEEANDAWYNAGGGVIRNAAGAEVSSFVGHELDLVATYQVLKNLTLELGYSHFFANSYVDDTSPAGAPADDADFLYLQTVLTF